MHVSTLFVLALLGWLGVCHWRPRWRWLKRGLLAFLVPLTLLVYPFTNNLLALWLEHEFDPDLACRAPPPSAIVILAGGVRDQPRGIGPWSRMRHAAATRILEGVSLAERHPGARLIFAGKNRETQNFEAGLSHLGVLDRERVMIEDKSSNTHLASLRVADLLRSQGLESVWLVTSALHMPRAMAAFRRAGVTVCPYPVDFTAQPSPRPWWIFPPPQALDRADRLAHEFLGLAWYWVTGKI